MNTPVSEAGSAPAVDTGLTRTARTAGFLYLGMGVAGIAGFLVLRPQLFDPADAAFTLEALTGGEQLARLAIALELVLAGVQALAALWFYRLFRTVDAFSAGMIAVFGLFNSVAFLVSAAAQATALQAALEPIGGQGQHQLMFLLSDNLWSVGGLFFGLWLLPMGVCALKTSWLPRPLGWLVVVGGAGYLVSVFVGQLLPGAELAVGLLTIPATIAEFWMIGCLLYRGFRGVPAVPLAGEGRA